MRSERPSPAYPRLTAARAATPSETGAAWRAHRASALRTVSLGLLGFVGGLPGCVSLAPADAPVPSVDVPAAWSPADAAGAGADGVSAASLNAWWQRFDDPQLAALMDSALRANTGITGAQAALRQAQALRDVAVAALWPAVNGQGTAERSKTPGLSTGNSFQLSANGSWTIDIFGAQRAAVDAAQAGVWASQASLGDVQVQIAAEVALDYIVLRTAQVRRVIAGDNLASQENTLQITLWRQLAGLVTSLETDQARSAVEQNRALLPALQTSILQSQHALAVLTGLPPTSWPELLDPNVVATIPQAHDGLVLAIPAATLRQRADVRATEQEVAAALARVRQAQANRRPSFAIDGTLGLDAATVGLLGNSGALLGSLLANVTVPLLNGGGLRAQVRVQQAALAQAQATYRAAVLGALQQVEDALVALNGDRLRLASLRLAADAATNASLIARQRYASGLIDFQTVLDTQRTQFATQDGAASASADVGSDHVRLFKALGGGWPSEPRAQNP